MTAAARRERGSVLLLVPAGFLVMVLLAGITVDQSLAFLRQRQATSVAIDVANDLATLALDEAEFRRSGSYRLDPERARWLAIELAERSDVGDVLVDVTATVTATVTGTDHVVVEIRARVEHIFTRAIPGAPTGTTVTARATATARAG